MSLIFVTIFDIRIGFVFHITTYLMVGAMSCDCVIKLCTASLAAEYFVPIILLGRRGFFFFLFLKYVR
jgi:hypothetical protein